MKNIYYQGYYLPEPLFELKSATPSLSPAAQFNPELALKRHSPWISSTSPESEPHPKTLVLTKESMTSFFKEHASAYLYWLSRLGFKVYLYQNTSVRAVDFEDPDYDIILEAELTSLAAIDETSIYEDLADAHLAKEGICLLSARLTNSLVSAIDNADACLTVPNVSFAFNALKYRHNQQDALLVLLQKYTHLPKQQRALLEQQASLINSSAYLISCLKQLANSPETQIWLLDKYEAISPNDSESMKDSLPYLTNSPRLQKYLIEKKQYLIIDSGTLVSCLRATQNNLEAQQYLLNAKQDLITDELSLANCLGLLENNAKAQKWLINEKQHLVTTCFSLYHLLSALTGSPAAQEQLIKQKADLIITQENITACLHLLKNNLAAQEWLLSQSRGFVKDEISLLFWLEILENYPEKQKDILGKRQDEIRDLRELKQCVAAVKKDLQLQQSLLNQKQDLITNPDELRDCLSVLNKNPTAQKALIESKRFLIINDPKPLREYLFILRDNPEAQQNLLTQEDLLNKMLSFITNADELRDCLSALNNNPTAQKALIKSKAGLLKNSAALLSCLRCIEKNPEAQEQLLNQRQDLIRHENIKQLLDRTLYNPTLQLRLIKKSFERYPFIKSRSEEDNPQRKVERLCELLVSHSADIPLLLAKHNLQADLLAELTEVPDPKSDLPYLFAILSALLPEYVRVSSLSEGDAFIRLAEIAFAGGRDRVLKSCLPIFELNAPRSSVHLYLHVDNDAGYGAFLAGLKSQCYPMLAFVELDGLNLEKLQRLLQTLHQHAPQLKYVSLPAACKGALLVPVPHRFRAPLPEINSALLQAGLTELYRNEESATQEEAEQAAIQFQTVSRGTLPKSILRVAQNGVSAFSTTGSNAHRTFYCVQAGHVLNPMVGDLPRTRVGVYERRQLASGNLSQALRQPNQNALSALPIIPYLTDSEVNALSIEPAEQQGFYVQFKQQLSPGLNRLLSIDANGRLLHIKTFLPKTACLYYNNAVETGDSCYYLWLPDTASEMIVEYIVSGRTSEQQARDYAALRSEDPRKKIIDAYRDNSNYQWVSEPSDSRIPKRENFDSIDSWLRALYEAANGSCSERVAAVEHVLNNSVAIRPYRVVRIDNNHDVLEIFDENNGWLCVDLGGSHSKEINLPATEVYQTSSQASAEAMEAVHTAHPSKKQTASETAEMTPAPTVSPALSQAADVVQDRRRIALRELVDNLLSIQAVNDVTVLEAMLQTNESLLLIHPNPIALQCFCLETAARQQKLAFFIDSPEHLVLAFESLHIERQENIRIDRQTALGRFLALGQTHPIQLIIDWSRFNPQMQTQFNSLLDTPKRLKGVELPEENLQIISLMTEAPKDESFLSRHRLRASIHCELSFEQHRKMMAYAESNSQQIIDLQGKSHWLAQLLGPIILINSQVHWQISDVARDLINGRLDALTLTHLNPAEISDCSEQLARAKAQGFLDYHGYHIPWHRHAVNIDSSPLCITLPERLTCLQNATADRVPRDAILINTLLFDYLLARKEITEDGQYSQRPGYLFTGATALSLWITSPLSEAQWYCLFDTAAKNSMGLSLFLAPNVICPLAIPEAKITEAVPIEDAPKRCSAIISERYQERSIGSVSDCLIIDLADLSYDDLFGCLRYEISEAQFQHFNYVESDFVYALKQGQSIVLRGQCDKSLLLAIEPLLAGREILLPNGEPLRTQSDIQLLLECDSHEKQSAPLAFLGQACTLYERMPAPLCPQNRYYTETICNTLPEDTISATRTFLDARFTALLSAIDNYPLIHVQGPTGVGKSYAMKSLAEQHPDKLRVYYDIETWLNASTEPEKNAVLFFDESNLTNQHLTFFNALKKGEPQLYYHGRVYPVSKQHRVVFASNAQDYGGGRVRQALFADNSIPILQFAPLPPAVIHEVLLKPLSEESAVTQAVFQAQARTWIAAYLSSQESANLYHKESIRELQQRAIDYLWENDNQPGEPAAWQISNNYVPLPSNIPSLARAAQFIAIHQAQRNQAFGHSGKGLNGYYIAGKPGTGKSAIFPYLLERAGYVLARPDNTDSPYRYHVIDPNLSLDEIRQLLITAFDSGEAIILNELNVCLQGHHDKASITKLESTLNSLLSGTHPLTGAPAKTPGFMAFFTGNSLALAGRRALSPALHHRCKRDSLPRLSVADINHLLAHHPRASSYFRENPRCDIGAFSTAIAERQTEDPRISIRFILNNLSSLLATYTQERVVPSISAPLPAPEPVVLLPAPEPEADRSQPPVAEAVLALRILRETIQAHIDQQASNNKRKIIGAISSRLSFFGRENGRTKYTQLERQRQTILNILRELEKVGSPEINLTDTLKNIKNSFEACRTEHYKSFRHWRTERAAHRQALFNILKTLADKLDENALIDTTVKTQFMHNIAPPKYTQNVSR